MACIPHGSSYGSTSDCLKSVVRDLSMKEVRDWGSFSLMRLIMVRKMSWVLGKFW